MGCTFVRPVFSLLKGKVRGVTLVELLTGSGPTANSCQYKSEEFEAPNTIVALA